MTRLLVALLAVLLVAPGVAEAKRKDCRDPILGDTDGDRSSETTAGVPERAGGGAVVVDGRERGTRTIALAGEGDRFGAAVALADLNRDGCADLLAGAPGGEAVYVVPGSRPAGLRPSRAYRIKSPGRGDEAFGAAVVVSDRESSRGYAKPTRDLWIGAPGADVGDRRDAGAIYHYTFRDGRRPRLAGRLTIGSRLLPGDSAAGDNFGAVLAPDAWGVLVGVPGRDVDGQADAGVLYRVRLSTRTGHLIAAQRFQEGRDGVGGTARAGDRFGAAVASNTRDGEAVIVGVPGEDLGDAADAGAVQVFDSRRRQRIKPTARHAQGDGRVPGTPETGDNFGQAVTVGRSLNDCPEAVQFAAGAPGEDVGGAADAGSVTVGDDDPFETGEGDTEACPFAVLTRGSGLPGEPRAHARLGAALGLERGLDDQDEDVEDSIAAAVPGEGQVIMRHKAIDVPSDGKVPVLGIPEAGTGLFR